MISLYLAYRMLNSTAREIKVNIDSVQQHITMHDRTPPVKTKQIRDKSPPVTRPRTRASTKLLKNVDSGNGLRKSMKSKKSSKRKSVKSKRSSRRKSVKSKKSSRRKSVKSKKSSRRKSLKRKSKSIKRKL